MRSISICQHKNSPQFAVQCTPSGSVVVTSVNADADPAITALNNVEIHRINGIAVFGLPFDHVKQLIGSCTRLEMLVSCRECVYRWIDVNTLAMTTAPPVSYLTRIDHPSYTNRWITLRTGCGGGGGVGAPPSCSVSSAKKPLGLVIRGGSEYSLGIFVSKVERNTAAAEAGLLVSDHIINVNGHDFRSIPHASAVRVLRSYSTLRLLVRYVGKLPEPVSSSNQASVSASAAAAAAAAARQVVLPPPVPRRPNPSPPEPSSTTIVSTTLAAAQPPTNRLDGVLSEGILDLLRKYRKGSMCIDELMNNLIPSVATDKLYLFEQIRDAIRAIDKDRYDNYVLRLEVGRLRRMAEVTASCLSLRDAASKKADTQIYGQIASCADISRLGQQTRHNGDTIRKDEKRGNPMRMSYLSSAARHYLKLYQEPEMVVVDKCRPFLGIAIEGSGGGDRGGVYCPFPRVVYLHPDGASAICCRRRRSRIGLGYLLIQVNSRSLEGLTHRQAARLIANLYKQPRPPWLEFVTAAPRLLTMIN